MLLIELRHCAGGYINTSGIAFQELQMKTTLLMCLAFAAANYAVAQTPPPDSTSPSSASSPHQRESTATGAKEASPQGNPEPEAASTPHQQDVTREPDRASRDVDRDRERMDRTADKDRESMDKDRDRMAREEDKDRESMDKAGDKDRDKMARHDGRKHHEMVKECIDKARSSNPSMSKDEAKKSCDEQLRTKDPG